ncbi:MAG: aldo/keto reductase [Treponema sp.]|jgi:predicted aldo/keto reductase-like oxidoreductase|nr:aldo/keto reductase [Treponema sp.]
MEYRAFSGLSLSRLGMGAMRLPTVAGQGEKIDERAARELIEAAYEAGVNYFDTAYRYHAGESERVTGKVLSQYPRDSFYLATKFPGHMMTCKDGAYRFTGMLAAFPARSPAELFEEQLEKCRVDYFDFYLLHNVCEAAWDFYTGEETGVVDYLLEQKKSGRIRHLGFSAHCRPETLERFVERYPVFEFAQIQLNYLDWTLQDAKRKYEYLASRAIPVWVMEPCRGGKLANLDEAAAALLKKIRPDDSLASWAFRWVKSLPHAQMILSGMNTLEQVRDNVKTFSGTAPMRSEEREALNAVIKMFANVVPCTSCRYCCEGCPQSLDIPRLIALYNEMSAAYTPSLIFTLAAFAEHELPENCVSCGACAQACPQSIDIPAVLKKLGEVIAARKSNS